MDRKEVIRLAKEDVQRFLTMEHPNGYLNFVVKRKKRKIIGYVRSTWFSDHTLYNRTVTKCHEDDTFNEHIGKAILCYKIFGFPVPEYYLEDYQKEVPENGDVMYAEGTYYAVGINNTVLRGVAFEDYCTGRFCSLKYAYGKVVDDTGYIEELTENSKMPNTPPTLSCYDRVKHDCGGDCQGASDCIIAKYYRDERDDMPTKKEMKEYIKEIKRSNRGFNKIAKDPEFIKEMNELINKIIPKK